MECSEIRDILPDFYLGNLPPEEAEFVKSHLNEHEECREALREVASVLDLLSLDAPSEAPPPQLRSRIMQTISSDESDEQRETSFMNDARARSYRTPFLVASCIAAASLAVVSVLAFLYSGEVSENEELRQQISSTDPAMSYVTLSETRATSGVNGMVVMDARTGQIVLGVYDLPEAPPGSEYRVWLVSEDGEATSLGAMELDSGGDGQMNGTMPEEADTYREIEITREPDGSDVMEGPVYLQGFL